MIKNTYHVIGVMSGTSLDGIDLCYVAFELNNNWQFKILQSKTYNYTNSWKKRLASLIYLTDNELHKIDVEYTQYTSQFIKGFISEFGISVIDFVSSHGHTAIHKPESLLTIQIGNRPELSDLINQKVVCDFRVQDVAFGGQGAPLVPIGDELLFHNYDSCLNLGGFANISFKKNNQRVAFDVCPFNYVLNFLSNKIGLAFDDAGTIARSGTLNKELLNQLNGLAFYNQKYPKSLGAEWVQAYFFPIINNCNISTKDVLKTCVIHFASQINEALFLKDNKGKVLLTGGGTFNSFFLETLRQSSLHEIVVPNKEIINFKEALIFAFLGVLKVRKEVNCLKSVTGAFKDHASGKIYYPKIS